MSRVSTTRCSAPAASSSRWRPGSTRSGFPPAEAGFIRIAKRRSALTGAAQGSTSRDRPSPRRRSRGRGARTRARAFGSGVKKGVVDPREAITDHVTARSQQASRRVRRTAACSAARRGRTPDRRRASRRPRPETGCAGRLVFPRATSIIAGATSIPGHLRIGPPVRQPASRPRPCRCPRRAPAAAARAGGRARRSAAPAARDRSRSADPIPRRRGRRTASRDGATAASSMARG